MSGNAHQLSAERHLPWLAIITREYCNCAEYEERG